MTPITKTYHNRVFKGFDDDSVEGGRVSDISVHDDGQTLEQNWKCVSIWDRIKFLFHGEISVSIYSQSLPPVSVCVGERRHQSVRVIPFYIWPILFFIKARRNTAWHDDKTIITFKIFNGSAYVIKEETLP